MPIKNLSDIRRLPRLGKVSLGIKRTTKKDGTECDPYPSEVDYFVCPPKVQEVFGKKPKELRIMFPIENEDVFFSQWYKSYGYNLLKCKGDGERAFTWDEESGGLKEIPCPCEKLEKNECRRIGILQFLLPDVKGAGIWQITTSSKNSIIDINSSVAFIRALCGRIRMIPLILKRVETETQRIENGKPKKGKHYTLQIDVEDISIRQLQQAAQIAPEKVLLPPPDESKDELFYPENGFAPEVEEKTEESEEIPDEEEPQEKKPDLVSLKKALSAILSTYFSMGKTLTEDENEMMARLETPEEKTTITRHELAIEYFERKIQRIMSKEGQKGQQKLI